MEEQFNSVKESLDENVVKEMQAKFTSLKEKLDGLADKSGMELVSALNEIKVEGAALANDLARFRRALDGEDTVPGLRPRPAQA